MVSIVVNHAKPTDSKAIIAKWMRETSETLANYDVSGHLNLISKKVVVHGVPKLGAIDYKDWAAQVKHEFAEKLIKSVDYQGAQIRAENATSIMFLTRERIVASDGSVHENELEVVLSKEEDGVWRVIQERILDADEMQHIVAKD